MAPSKLILRAAILAIAVVLFTLPVSARADTYQILLFKLTTITTFSESTPQAT
jgi:hypothetical protein